MSEFSDDELDALDAEALQALENHATQLTQLQFHVRGNTQQTPIVLDDDFDDDDLGGVFVTDEARPQPLAPRATTAATGAATLNGAAQLSPDQQDTWDGPVPIPASRFRPEVRSFAPIQPPQRPSLGNRPPVPQTFTGNAQASQLRSLEPGPRLPGPVPTTQQQRYQTSQASRHSLPPAPNPQDTIALQNQLRDLQALLLTKEGETQILRKRLEKNNQDHDREVQLLKRQTADQLSKHEKTVEVAKAAEQSATTELEFMRRDLKEELVRARRKDGGATTPKKNQGAAKAWGIADGFSDMEMAGSPTRGQRGKNSGPVAGVVVEPPAKVARTPTKGKRKRPVTESPVQALEMQDDDVPMLDAAAPRQRTRENQPAPPKSNSDYFKAILNHSAAYGRPLAFDFLAGFALPSRPTESLAAILFEKLAMMGDIGDPTRLPIEFCEEVIELWNLCFKEDCLGPITELVSFVTLSLQLNTVAIAPYIASSLLPVAMDTYYAIGISRFNNQSPGDPTDAKFATYLAQIPTTEVLSLMYLTVLGCVTSSPVGGSVTPPALDFWSQIHIEFVLMLLDEKQPLDDFLLMLQLLCTSVFPESIGPIAPHRSQDEYVPSLIDRVSRFLVLVPGWDLDKAGLIGVRIAMLRTLAAFARSDYGIRQLASSEVVIPRLVVLMSWCIDELYEGDMTISNVQETPSARRQPFQAPSAESWETEDQDGGPTAEQEDSLNLYGPNTLLSNTMLLLHTIVTSDRSQQAVNVQAKLERVTGGAQSYMLALARLNFAEDMINEETAELAHDLLERSVTAEDGEVLGTFFGS